MIQKTLLLVFLLGIVRPVLSQDKDFKITFEVNDDKSVDFYFEKESPGSITVSMDFSFLNNSTYGNQIRVIKRRRGRLFKLRPINEERSIQFNYTYTYQQGALKPHVDDDFVYLLPFKKGAKVFVQEMSNLGAHYYGSEEPKNWKVYQFTSDDSDTVYAARKAIVIDVEDRFQLDMSTAYTSSQNKITVEHTDGTLAVYKGFGQKGVFVEPGDVVFPQTPLGITTEGVNSGPLVFSVFFLYDDDFAKQVGATLKNQNSVYQYVTPSFLTTEGVVQLKSGEEYEVGFSPDAIVAEMTRREKRKVEKNR